MRLNRETGNLRPADFNPNLLEADEVAGLSVLLFEVLFQIAKGDIDYITVGKSRSRDKLLITFNVSGQKAYAGGATASELAYELADTLEADPQDTGPTNPPTPPVTRHKAR